MFLFLAILIINLKSTSANILCNDDSPRTPKYHLMEKCHRSKLGIAAKAQYSTLASCLKLGIEKKALALNFSPPEAASEEEDALEYTCEVLKCAEAEGGLSLVNDTRFDYYSIYAKPLPNVNTTCVPATGMFQLLEKRLNFTQAVSECRNVSGVLPDVTSEQRTDALAQMLAGAGVDAALVGLRRSNKTGFIGNRGVYGWQFQLLEKRLNFTQAVAECRNVSGVLPDVTSEQRTDALAQMLAGAGVDAALVGLRRSNKTGFIGDNLDCTTYRAWAPGHPRRHVNKFDCVVLTKNKMWQSVSCKKQHYVLCELVPGGPYRRGSIFASTKIRQNSTINNDTLTGSRNSPLD